MWLGVERILTSDKRPALFPEDSPALRAATLAEPQRFVDAVVFEGSGRFSELLTADWSIVNGDLATRYDLAPGPDWSEVDVGEERGGLLGHASVLASYAHSDQNSPVRRGLFVREHLLCQSLGTPPPEAGGVPDVDPDATTCERFEQHSADPVCAGCHQYIDPVGFGFERFDALGGYRTVEHGQPIPTDGSLAGRDRFTDDFDREFNSVSRLGGFLATSTSAPTCFTAQLLRFGLGRVERFAHQCVIDELSSATRTWSILGSSGRCCGPRST